MIKKENLKIGGWYIGKGRGFHVALWDGKFFRSFSERFGHYVEKATNHWDDGGTFAPMVSIPGSKFTNKDIDSVELQPIPKKCEECDGVGEVPWNSYPPEGTSSTVPVQCRRCFGKGKICE